MVTVRSQKLLALAFRTPSAITLTFVFYRAFYHMLAFCVLLPCTGWFAKEDIKAGESIWWAGEYDRDPTLRVHMDVLKTWPKDKLDKFMSLAYMIAPDVYSGYPEEGTQVPMSEIEENYVNHSCNGNCWYQNGELLIAMKDIKAGDEIAYDYALTECNPEWSLKCLCGHGNCRGTITGNDWKKPELQAQYGRFFLPHILKLIDDSKK